MPGLIGLVGRCATRTAVDSAANSIVHFDDYRNKYCAPVDNVEVAQVWRNSKEISGSWHRDHASQVTVFVNGTIVEPGIQPQQLDAADILSAYLSGKFSPERYDGSFVVAIADPRTKQMMVCNDRLGFLPCYYFADDGRFCFAPEAKAIFAALETTPEFSVSGLVTFLAIGHCLADTTIFESVRILEPGSILLIDTQTAEHTVKRNWCMHYDPAPEFRSRRIAEEALYESIIAGHRSSFANAEEQYDLLLSGGWDSRGMLAAADKLGRMPRRSISWGLRDDVPQSDPYLAAQLARQYGIEHRFIPYDTDAFIGNASQWSYITELNTDNFGWYGEGTNILLNEYTGDVDFVVTGDEIWGGPGHVRNKDEIVRASHMAAPFPEPLAKILSPELRTDCAEIYAAEIDKVLRMCTNENPNDRRNFMYIHGRAPRFNFGLGYYKELAVEVRRPFLSTNVLDIMQQIPVRLRYGKNLYISTLIRFFPEILNVHKRSEPSLPQWRRDLREKPELSRYFANLLSNDTLSRTSFAKHIDLFEIEKIVTNFFATPHEERVRNVDRTAQSGGVVQSIKQRIAAYDDVRMALGLAKPARQTQFDNFNLLRRLALLSLLDQNLGRFAKSSMQGPVANLA